MMRMRWMTGVLMMALMLGSSGALGAAGLAQDVPKATRNAATTPINLNTASAADLEHLPGVGPALAARIVEYRDKNGGFKKIEELMNVRGIGEKSFLKLKPQLSVTPPKGTER
jgi:comEA protein